MRAKSSGTRKDKERIRKESFPRLESVIDVVLPVLNEAKALPLVLGQMPPEFYPLVVDNGSTDGSAGVAAGFGVRVVVEPQRGFGAACWAGLLAATSDIVCFMDCDGSLDPEALAGIARPISDGQADLVLGKRIPEPGAWPVHARLANRLLSAEVRRRTGLRIHDIGPMRAARREALLELGIRDRRFGWPLEMVLRAASANWRIAEVPVEYRARTGRSKVTGTLRGTLRASRDMVRALR